MNGQSCGTPSPTLVYIIILRLRGKADTPVSIVFVVESSMTHKINASVKVLCWRKSIWINRFAGWCLGGVRNTSQSACKS